MENKQPGIKSFPGLKKELIFMDRQNSVLFSRIIAALIDMLFAWIFVVIPVIGGVISVLYLLFKDALPYQITKDDEWKNKSLGKKLMNLEVNNLKGEIVDLQVSALRNIPLTIGNFIAIIPVLGWIIGPVVGVIFVTVELILLLTDKNNRRLGDRWANTKVSRKKDLSETKTSGTVTKIT